MSPACLLTYLLRVPTLAVRIPSLEWVFYDPATNEPRMMMSLPADNKSRAIGLTRRVDNPEVYFITISSELSTRCTGGYNRIA